MKGENFLIYPSFFYINRLINRFQWSRLRYSIFYQNKIVNGRVMRQGSNKAGTNQTKIPQITSSIISYSSSYCSLGCHKFSPGARSTRRADIEFVKEDLLSLRNSPILPKSREGFRKCTWRKDGLAKLPEGPRVTREIDNVLDVVRSPLLSL